MVNDGIDLVIDSTIKITSISKEVLEFLHKNLIDDKSDMYFGIVDHYQIDRIIVEIMALGMRSKIKSSD